MVKLTSNDKPTFVDPSQVTAIIPDNKGSRLTLTGGNEIIVAGSPEAVLAALSAKPAVAPRPATPAVPAPSGPTPAKGNKPVVPATPPAA